MKDRLRRIALIAMLLIPLMIVPGLAILLNWMGR